MSVLQKLTEGIVDRNLKKEGAALLDKWERTGLLEGIVDDTKKQGMARLLENQAGQLLKEASAMSSGDVEGFASVAFPIVRRVFGELIANELVSVQPMSLPSGLIFFMDFVYGDTLAHVGATKDKSLYGGGVVGSQITGGVTDITEESGSFYNLNNGYSSPTGSQTGYLSEVSALHDVTASAATEAQKKLCQFDPDIDFSDSNLVLTQLSLIATGSSAGGLDNADFNNLTAFDLTTSGSNTVIRRLTTVTEDPKTLTFTIKTDGAANGTPAQGHGPITVTYPLADNFANSDTLGAVVGAPAWGLEGAGNESDPAADGNEGRNDDIREIDIKVDSIAVTAQTKKLKAKWTPELGQDLNAYHNLDAEVELTQILSEQIALEIDREVLNDLVKGATAGTYYWSRAPGLFVKRDTGVELGASSAAPDFTGTVSEWYETLVETINDMSAQIHRKTLRGGANFLVVSPEVANILEFTSGFRASVTHDDNRGTVGAVNVGSLSRKFEVYVDPYFLRNVVLVGRKGNSFLESGYVYAPYVPLQVTPTIFGPEDFVPRKGVMTRYAKKMVRPDMYGLVIVRGLLGEEGATS
jgi:hypothetical protein